MHPVKLWSALTVKEAPQLWSAQLWSEHSAMVSVVSNAFDRSQVHCGLVEVAHPCCTRAKPALPAPRGGWGLGVGAAAEWAAVDVVLGEQRHHVGVGDHQSVRRVTCS